LRCQQVLFSNPNVSKRSWVILGVAAGLLIGAGAPSTARADLESDEEPGEQPDEQATEAPDKQPSESPSEEPSEPRHGFTDDLSWQLLVSSYYMFNAHRVAGPYNAFEYPYADSHGFWLVFAGGDVGYRTDKWGVTLNLRWGENVDRLSEFAPLTRGFATWIPHEKLSLDLGYFGARSSASNRPTSGRTRRSLGGSSTSGCSLSATSVCAPRSNPTTRWTSRSSSPTEASSALDSHPTWQIASWLRRSEHRFDTGPAPRPSSGLAESRAPMDRTETVIGKRSSTSSPGGLRRPECCSSMPTISSRREVRSPA